VAAWFDFFTLPRYRFNLADAVTADGQRSANLWLTVVSCSCRVAQPEFG